MTPHPSSAHVALPAIAGVFSPIGVLSFAGAYAVLEATQGGLFAFATAGVAASLLLWRPIHPPVLLCAAAALDGVVLPVV